MCKALLKKMGFEIYLWFGAWDLEFYVEYKDVLNQ